MSASDLRAKALDALVKRSPDLVILCTIVFGMTYMHAQQLQQLRKDFLDHAQTAMLTASETDKQQAEALKDLAAAVKEQTAVILKNDGHVETLIRVLGDRKG